MQQLVCSYLGLCVLALLVPSLSYAETAPGLVLDSAIVAANRSAVCERLIAREHDHLPPFCHGTVTPPEPPVPPEPTIDHVIITEVLYDLLTGGTQGSEGTGANNEWVELYNPTNEPVDLAGWTIGDAVSSDVLSVEPLVLGAGAHLIITGADSTVDFWLPTSATIVVLGSAIGSGLNNSGDAVLLHDQNGVVIDALSYGGNLDVLNPSILGGLPGESIARSDLSQDTGTAADWTVAVPTFGY